MNQGGVTWIVIADAAEARIFSERVRFGALRELPEQRMTINDTEPSAGRHGAGEGS